MKLEFNAEFSKCLKESTKNLGRLSSEDRLNIFLENSVSKEKNGISVKLSEKPSIINRFLNAVRYAFSNKVAIGDLDAETMLSVLIAYHKYQWQLRNDTPENAHQVLVDSLNKQIRGEKDSHDKVIENFEQNLISVENKEKM
jgi:hypothetical protein